MNKNKLIVLGNGFSIDFIKRLSLEEKVDVRNLFKYGDILPWPANMENGFLSHKYCPHLWSLGARPNMPAEDCMKLIEDVITCYNVYAITTDGNRQIKQEEVKNLEVANLYLRAYNELTSYLWHLFVFLNNRIDDSVFNSADAKKLPWIKYLQSLVDDPEIEAIQIVTYNYDIILERLLIAANIAFRVLPFQKKIKSAKVHIYKPHGSISFISKENPNPDSFRISTDPDASNGSVNEFKLQYKEINKVYTLTPLIPPAAEANRYKNHWAHKIRTEILSVVKNLKSTDELIICGLSYWHVDRQELDKIIVECDPRLNVKLINPNPPRSFLAVLTSTFPKFIHYTTAEALEK